MENTYSQSQTEKMQLFLGVSENVFVGYGSSDVKVILMIIS